MTTNGTNGAKARGGQRGPRQTKDLSVEGVKKKLRTPGRHRVSKGLYVEVKPTGASSWSFRYMRDGCPHELGFGTVDLDGTKGGVRLAEARDEAAKALAMLNRGVDPLAARRAARVQSNAPPPQEATFRAVAADVLKTQLKGLTSAKSRYQWEATLAFACDAIGDKHVADITNVNVASVLEPIWTEKNETAQRLRGRIEAVFAAAIAKGLHPGPNPALWRGNLDALLTPPKALADGDDQNQPALPWDRAPEFWRALDGMWEGRGRLALELAIVTALRSGTVRQMTWADVFWEERILRLPARIMKGKRKHEVPITPLVGDVLNRVRRRFPPADRASLLLPGAGTSPRQPISDATLLRVIQQMNEDAERAGFSEAGGLPFWHDPDRRCAIVVHGFRSTFSTYLQEAALFPQFVGDAALAHKQADRIAAAYTRSKFMALRRWAYLSWEHFLTTGEIKRMSYMEAQEPEASPHRILSHAGAE